MKSESFLKEWRLCPYDILPLKIKRIADFHVLLCELDKCVCAKISDAKAKNKKLEKTLIGFRFTMENQKVVVMEVQDFVTTTKQELKVILQQKHKLEKKVICFVLILHLI